MRYDWRTRFGLGLDCLPEVMGWDEALDHIRTLRSDPSSQIASALEGWDYPLDRLGWMMADLIDVQGSSKAGKKWKTYDARPIKARDGVEKKRRGNAAGRSRAEVIEILRGFGHGAPV